MSSNERLTDLTYLKEASSENYNFIKEMIGIFLNQTPEYLDSLKENSENQKWDEFKKVLHKLKPTITMMGMKKGDLLVKEMESLIKSQSMDEVPPLFAELENMCRQAFVELQEELGK